MALLPTPRRPFALVAKIALAVALVMAVFSIAGFRCWGGACTCTPRLVDTYTLPYSRVGALAVHTAARLLYASADDAMAIAVFDLDDVVAGPLFSVPTEGYLTGAALDEAANRLYVPQGFSKSVRVIDGITHEHHDISVPDVTNAIGSIVVDPVRHRLYVVRSDDFNVAMFDTQSERYIGPVGQGCCTTPDIRLAIDTTTGLLFVLETHIGRLNVYRGADRVGQALAAVEFDGPASRIAIDTIRRRAYVSQDERHRVAVVDIEPTSASAFRVVTYIPLRERPSDIALDPASPVGYVTNNSTDTLSLIDPVSNRWIMDVPIGFQPHYMAVDWATARLYVGLGNQEIAIVQGCSSARRGLAALLGSPSRPTPARQPREIATPVEHSSPTEAARRRDYVRCERMFRIRTNCVDGATTHEAVLAMKDVAASGATVVDGGAAGQYCGVGPDNVEPDLAAAGYYYSVPVLATGAVTPTVWTFESATRTMLTEAVPTMVTLRVTRVDKAPESPWRESLWWLSRCKTKALGAPCCP